MKKLGFGLMRLPSIDDQKALRDGVDEGEIDLQLVNQMVDTFIENGFTYFDTAWMYCHFQSEEVAKECLVKRYPRDAFTLATKLHAGYLKTKEDRDHIFNEQLRKTPHDYFDYYLLHDNGFDHDQIYEKLDCYNWLIEKKKEGLVKHIGFSFHDNAKTLEDILKKHPEFEFVQLQINYLDWESEGVQSRKCYEVCQKYHKPVIVMEPVKGGTLAKVPESVEKLFKDYAPDMSIPSWAIRFAASHEGVMMVLSGMSNMEQMLDNISYMKDFQPLGQEELALIDQAVDMINAHIAIACTGCSYCTDGCPMNIPIPQYFSLYNAEKQEIKEKGWTPQGEYYSRLSQKHAKASDCIQCGQCEGICPQHLSIIEYLQEIVKEFE